MNVYKKAFTLAEVLIVLGIIGIIADMTIPNLKRDIDKTVYVTQLKKAYSSISQGLQMIMVTEGVSNIEDTSLFTGATALGEERQNAIDIAVKATFNTIKTCKYRDSACSITGYKKLNKTTDNEHFNLGYNFYTADGAAVRFYFDNTCSNGNCGAINIDVNGTKNPNIVGRDFFTFLIDEGGFLYAKGSQKAADNDSTSKYWKDDQPKSCGTAGSSNIASGAEGHGCAARIMEEGWKMNY